MARIIEEHWEEHEVYCRHCGSKIGCTVDDVVLSSYDRGLDYEPDADGNVGWWDGDCLWHYIECPKCGKYICITDVISVDEDAYLERKYNAKFNY